MEKSLEYSDEISSCCSTPYVSAPSSPTRPPLPGFYYSAPTSPTHFVISSSAAATDVTADVTSSFEFDFSGTFPSTGASSPESMTSADELFFNGQIRPMKLSTHLQRPQILSPLIEELDDEASASACTRGRDLVKLRAGSRRTRSMSPLRSTTSTSSSFWNDDEENDDDVAVKVKKEEEEEEEENVDKIKDDGSNETTPCASRSSSAGRSSRRWIFLKEFLYRSKSEGSRNDNTNHNNKFWGSLTFSPVVKDKKSGTTSSSTSTNNNKEDVIKKKGTTSNNSKSSGIRKGNVHAPSAHERHYTAKRAQAEEMRKKTYLPYRQGLFGCLGFSSKSYGAMNGFARALNTVSSR